jgi:ribosome-associated protein
LNQTKFGKICYPEKRISSDIGIAFDTCHREESLKFTIFAINQGMKNKQEQDFGKLEKTIIESIDEIKGQNIVKIDLSKTDNSVCEFFIITHADSDTQVRGIAKNIEKNLKEKHQFKSFHAEGYENAQWVLLDYSSIVVHVFLKEIRNYYKLEELWADAEIEIVSEPEEDF